MGRSSATIVVGLGALLAIAGCTSQNRSEVNINLTDVGLGLSIQRYGCNLSNAVVSNYGRADKMISFQLYAQAPDSRTIQIWSARCDTALPGGTAGCILNLDRTFEPTGGLGCPMIGSYQAQLMSVY
jgi:hypothetical protein